MKKALICGVSGQDGSYLAKFLLSKGYSVTGTSRDIESNSFKGLIYLGIKEHVNLVSMSMTNFKSVLEVVEHCNPDEIYNLSGQSSVSMSFDFPIETIESINNSVLNLLEAIRFSKKKIKLYNASSGDCFGGNNGNPCNENTAFNPKSPYAVGKAAAFWAVENYKVAYDIFACNGILFNHESVIRSDRFVLKKIIKSAVRISKGSKEKLTLGDLSICRDWGWAPEYVEVMWKIMQHKEPENFVVATGKSESLKNFALKVFDKLNLNLENYIISSNEFKRPTEIKISYGDPSKVKKLLNWEAKYDVNDVLDLMLDHEIKISN